MGDRRAVEDRFWEKVKKTDTCWLWTAYTTNGYGRINIGGHSKAVHVVSHKMNVGPIPQGMWVLHKCDVRNCVRPDHLFLGTVVDNNRDMYAKGRAFVQVDPEGARKNGIKSAIYLRRGRGENSSHVKLSEDMVKRLISDYWRDLDKLPTFSELARKYGIGKHNVRSIIRGETWSHLMVGHNG